MTITHEDREGLRSTVDEFHAQHELDSCLPTALRNILHEFADRKDEPGLRHSVSDIGDVVDYIKGRASATDRLASRVDPLVEGTGYEVNIMTGIGHEQLQMIMDSDDRSLPICELHSKYFEEIHDYIDSYVPEPGVDGFGRWPHTVTPLKFNDKDVLYHDPYLQFFRDAHLSKELGAIELPIRVFNEWWSRPEKRWTLWIEPMDQMTLAIAGVE